LTCFLLQRQSPPKNNHYADGTLITASTIERFDTQTVDLPTIRPHKLATVSVGPGTVHRDIVNKLIGSTTEQRAHHLPSSLLTINPG
jgi:hypothetical protein